jgi:hypothetical protein
MRHKVVFSLILALAAAQLSSCERKTFDPALAGDYFPLRPGLTWTYRIVEDGARNRATIHTLTERVLGRTGAQTSKVESEYAGPSGVFNSTIIYFTEHGYLTRQLIISRSAGVASAERAFLPQLLKPNLTWSNSLVPFVQQPDLLHIAQTHRTFFDHGIVEVPAGHFSGCIRIESLVLYRSPMTNSQPLKLHYVDWYAPHIGLVKTLVEQDGLFGSELARIELLEFGYPQPHRSQPLPISASSVSRWQLWSGSEVNR